MPDETKPNPEETPSAPAQESAEQAAKGESAEPAAPELPENAVEVEDAGLLKKKVTIKISQERIAAKMSEMFGDLSKSAMVPGFRVGHAPRRLIEKRFGKEVSHDVRNNLIGEALQPALVKSKIQPIGEPSLDLEKIELPEKGELSFSFEIEVVPEFTLPELDGIKVKKPVITVTEDKVDEQIEQWRLSQARYEASEGEAAKGDAVEVDASVSGEGVEAVKSDGLMLRVAPGQIQGLPLIDLGDALEGKKAGDDVQVKVKAPEAHPNELWRNKDLTVDIKVKAVRSRVLPEVNDEFAKAAGFESLADFRQFFMRNLEARIAEETKRVMRAQIEEYLLNNTKVDLPEGVAARHTAGVLQRRYIDLLYRGVPREKIDEKITELQTAAAEQANRELRLEFILGKVAIEAKLEVNDDEINSRIAEIARQNNRRPEKVKQELQTQGGVGQIEIGLLEEKAIDTLLAKANVSEQAEAPKAEEAPAAEEPKKAKKAAKSEEAKPEEAKADAKSEEGAAPAGEKKKAKSSKGKKKAQEDTNETA